MAPPLHLETPLSTFYPVNFGELFRSPAKGQGSWLAGWPGCLAPAHLYPEANYLLRLPCFLQVLSMYLFCFVMTGSYSAAQEGMQLTILPRMMTILLPQPPTH